MRQALIAVALAGVSGLSVMASPGEAQAQTQVTLSPDGKGITGCALLGAETVALIEAAAGVRARWAYLVFPLLGAAAGGIGGYFLEDAAGSPADQTLTGISVGSLVLGLGLLIPTTVAYVSATSYRPESESTEDNAPGAEPLEESTTGPRPSSTSGSGATEGSGSSGGTAPATTPTSGSGGSGGSTGGTSGGSASTSGLHHRTRGVALGRPVLPPSLLNLDLGSGGMNLGVPAVSVTPSYSWAEVRQFGLVPQSELRIPIVSGTF